MYQAKHFLRTSGSLIYHNSALFHVAILKLFHLQVDLRHNKISKFRLKDVNIMNNIKKYRQAYFDIGGNPFDCGCDSYEFVQILNEKVEENIRRFNIDNLKCAEPATAVGVNVDSLKSDTLTCPVDSIVQRENYPCMICNCYKRPHNNTLIVDCSALHLKTAPKLIDSSNFDWIELSLGNNRIKKISTLDTPDYQKLVKLDLSHNLIETFDEKILPTNLKVLNIN